MWEITKCVSLNSIGIIDEGMEISEPCCPYCRLTYSYNSDDNETGFTAIPVAALVSQRKDPFRTRIVIF